MNLGDPYFSKLKGVSIRRLRTAVLKQDTNKHASKQNEYNQTNTLFLKIHLYNIKQYEMR